MKNMLITLLQSISKSPGEFDKLHVAKPPEILTQEFGLWPRTLYIE